jgi:hypothetical protein
MIEKVKATVSKRLMATFAEDGELGQVRVDCAVDEADCPVQKRPLRVLLGCNTCPQAAETEKELVRAIGRADGDSGTVTQEGWVMHFIGREFYAIFGENYFEIKHVAGEVTLRRQPIDLMEVRGKN